MHSLDLALQGAWKVLLAGLVLGAGLPLLFALGIRSMAYGAGRDAAASPRAHPAGTVAGYLLFAVVLFGVALGLVFIVASGFGKALSFEHIYPTIVNK